MVAGKAPGPVHRGGDREPRPDHDEQELSRHRFGRPTTRRRCWAFWFMVTRPACSPVASWNGQPTIPWRSASSRRTIILITTRSPLFRRRFLKEIEALFVKVLLLAREMGVRRWARWRWMAPKSTPMPAAIAPCLMNTPVKIEAQLKEEVAELLAKAEAADQTDVPDGMSIPEELARRQDRLEKLAVAKAKIEAARGGTLCAGVDGARGEAGGAGSEDCGHGQKPRGKPPQPPVQGLLPKDQINLTDEESRIMPVAGGGFEQCYNAQAVVTGTACW